MYCIHQTEEHAYDFRGWHYSFVPYLNEGFTGRAFAAACPDGEISCPMDPKMTLFVNAGAIWVGFGGCMLAAAVNPRFGLAGYLCWGTARIVNGLFGHLLPAPLTLLYNPGCVQSAVMVPLGVYVISRSQRPKLCVANGFLFHAVAFGMGLNVIPRARAPEAAVAVITVAAMALLVPLAIKWKVDQRRDVPAALFRRLSSNLTYIRMPTRLVVRLARPPPGRALEVGVVEDPAEHVAPQEERVLETSIASRGRREPIRIHRRAPRRASPAACAAARRAALPPCLFYNFARAKGSACCWRRALRSTPPRSF